MPNSQVVVKKEGLIKWTNASKTGAANQTLALNKGGIKITTNRPRAIITTDAGVFSHMKQPQDPDTSVTISALYRDKAGSLLDNAANGFEVADSGISCPMGTLYHEAAYGASSFDVINVANVTLMGYTLTSAPDGVMIELRFAGVGEPTYGTAAVATNAITPGNTEAMVAAETYVRFKAPGGTPATLGFIKGGWRLEVNYNKTLVRKTDGTFSHGKKLRDPSWSLQVTQLYQDATTNLLADATNGYGKKATGVTVPVGTIAVEGTFADGTTLESIQCPNATLTSWDFSQAEDGDPLVLNFAGMGLPTFASATLS